MSQALHQSHNQIINCVTKKIENYNWTRVTLILSKEIILGKEDLKKNSRLQIWT